MQSTPQLLTHLRENWRAAAGRAAVVSLLLFLGFFLVSKRLSPTRFLIRRAARLRIARGHVGSVVRWGNVLQTAFPSVAMYTLLYLALDTIGFEHVELQLFWVFVHWIGLYWIGRQILLGNDALGGGAPAGKLFVDRFH